MAFEMYQKMNGAGACTEPRVTLTSNQLNFNQLAIDKYFVPLAKSMKLKNISHVKLGYDVKGGASSGYGRKRRKAAKRSVCSSTKANRHASACPVFSSGLSSRINNGGY